MPTAATAPHLPSTSDTREAGVISSGSSDPRSRSPAVVSSAALSAPYSTAISTKNGSMPVKRAARDCGLARSRSCTSTTSIVAGATPRNASRSVDCSLEKPRSSRVRRPTAAPARWLADDDTSSTSGGCPAASSASNSRPITSTGSPSFCDTSCAS